VRWLRAAVVPVALAGLIALAGVALGRIYADALLTQLVAGAAVGSVAVGAAVRRLPSWTVAPLSVLALAGYTVLALRIAAARADLTDPLPRIFADALANGIPRLLTAMIPVESTPDTVVVPVVAAWLAGLAGAELVVRNGRVLLGCLPAVALYAGALYVVGPNATAAGWPTFAFAGLVVVALATTARPSDGTAVSDVPATARAAVRGRALVGAAAGLIIVVGLIAVVGPWVSGRVAATPVDPRKYVEPPQVDSLDESPLNRISGWALTPEQKLLEVRTGAPVPTPSAGPTGTDAPAVAGSATRRLCLAVLPDYDGVTWRVGATYRNAGRVLPPQPVLPGAAITEVHQEITVDGLTGRLLPVVPAPTAVEGARVAYDAATGTLIRPEGLTPGLTYSVTSEVQTPDLNLLTTADAPSGDAVARFLKVGAGVPDQIQRLADHLADGNGAAFDRATAIEEFLAEHYRKVPDAPSGHAYPNLQFFLFGPREQGGQRGTSEQFAASFALLARLTGLPSRVVVGFDVPKGGGTVTAADAVAWPEVLFTDLGWVPFDPMPKSKDPRPVEEDFTPKPSTPPPTTTEAPPPSDAPSASARPAVLAAEPGVGPPAALVAGGASGSVLFLLAAAAFVVVLMRRSLRRRRLTLGDPDERIAGAWYEFTDALRLDGRPVPAHLAATEAAAFAAAPPAPSGVSRRSLLRRAAPAEASPPHEIRPDGTRPDGTAPLDHARADVTRSGGRSPAGAPMPPLDELVAAVNTTAFAPGAADAAQAERAGAQAVAYADALRERRTWWRRAWWSIHPGPLRWHRPPSEPGERRIAPQRGRSPSRPPA
jgi:transglutaminase-like putative cysteine protease